MLLTDTIIAISSTQGPPGPRAILRLSGPYAHPLAQIILSLPSTATTGYHPNLTFHEFPSTPLASALLFQSPKSFTGQDIAELHLPNSPALLRHTLQKILASATPGAPVRMAHPGEFSARAFFNGKLDLTQAEGIAATIHATSELELRAAASLREGDLHHEIDRIANRLADLLAKVEAGIDFSDEEDIHFIDADAVQSDLSQLSAGIQYWLAHSVRVDRLQALPTVVFVGQPNVGKSTLVNLLARQERSMTSPVAGTTRDMLSAIMQTPDGDVRLVDVPGEESPIDEMRMKMMAARQAALLEADLIIEVLADEHHAVSGLHMSSRYGADCYTVQNKVDLLPASEISTTAIDEESGEPMVLRGKFQLVSAKTGFHIDNLRTEISKLVHRRALISHNLPAINQRHRSILQEVKLIVNSLSNLGDDDLRKTPELLAAELRRALDLLGQITGTISPDEVLGRIFSQFCIGK